MILKLIWSSSQTQAYGDLLAQADGVLVAELGLSTAVFISLGTDREPHPDDDVPEGFEPGGWWADAMDGKGRKIGSRLWLLQRATISDETISRAASYVDEALAWMIEDKIANSVTVTAGRYSVDTIQIETVIDAPEHLSDSPWRGVWLFVQE